MFELHVYIIYDDWLNQMFAVMYTQYMSDARSEKRNEHSQHMLGDYQNIPASTVNMFAQISSS